LYDLGITNIDILLKNQEKLNHHQKLGLKYVIRPCNICTTYGLINYFRYLNDFEQKIPRSEIIEIEQIIKETLNNLDPKYKITICGSYRLVSKCLQSQQTICYLFKCMKSNVYYTYGF